MQQLALQQGLAGLFCFISILEVAR